MIGRNGAIPNIWNSERKYGLGLVLKIDRLRRIEEIKDLSYRLYNHKTSQ